MVVPLCSENDANLEACTNEGRQFRAGLACQVKLHALERGPTRKQRSDPQYRLDDWESSERKLSRGEASCQGFGGSHESRTNEVIFDDRII